jgi:hypothetical protein
MGAMIALLKRTRVGVGARIYLSIGAIVALTIAASIVASLSFGRVEQTVRSLVDEHYPVVELSRELALVAAATVATASARRSSSAWRRARRACAPSSMICISARLSIATA